MASQQWTLDAFAETYEKAHLLKRGCRATAVEYGKNLADLCLQK